MMWLYWMALKSGLPTRLPDERGEYILDERSYNRSKCAADDDADSQIEDVAAQNKITKSLEHRYLLKSLRTCYRNGLLV